MLNKSDEGQETVVPLDGLRRREPRFNWSVWLIWAIVITTITFGAYWTDLSLSANDPRAKFYVPPLIGALWATLLYGSYAWIRSAAYKFMLRRAAEVSIERRTEFLQADLEKDFFNNLVKINFKYIDKYYLQTQIQADKAFTISAIAAFVGFAIIIAGIAQMYFGNLEPAYVTTAAGVASEFIAGVFFYLYNQTILKMADYHKKLVLTQNIGLALRITRDLPDAERVSSQCSLVDRLSADINAMLSNAKLAD